MQEQVNRAVSWPAPAACSCNLLLQLAPATNSLLCFMCLFVALFLCFFATSSGRRGTSYTSSLIRMDTAHCGPDAASRISPLGSSTHHL